MRVRTCDETARPVKRRADCCIAALTVVRETSFGIAATAVLPQGLDDGRGDGRSQSATHQSVPNQSAAMRLAALDGPDRPAKAPRRLLVRAAFQVAEHHRRAIFLRQPVHLFVDRGIEIEVARCPDLDGAGRILLRANAARACAVDGRSPGDKTPCGRRPDGARGPASLAPRAIAPCGPGRGRWPGRHLPLHARRATIARQTRQTIASCRSTSAEKASSATSSASVANRSRSWPSVRSPMVPIL